MAEDITIINEEEYAYIVEKFGDIKIASRYDWLEGLLKSYIAKNELEGRVIISQDILKHIIIDYFVDVDRLKEFQEIEKIHMSKIYAYLSYWILRHKPIQIISAENAGDISFINEEFVSHFIRSYLFSELDNTPILEKAKEKVDSFVDTMLYFFQYREYSAKNIELMILAFQAGCGYQYSYDHKK